MKLLDPHKLGKNHDFTKRVNRATVLGLLRRGEGLSRADLARETGLSIQSLSNIVAELEAAGLIEAKTKVYGGKGQPPRPYGIRPEAGWAIGINLDEDRVGAVITDYAFACRGRIERDHRARDAGAVLGLLTEVVGALLDAAGQPGEALWGIGLATPELVDSGVADIGLLEASLWVELGQSGLAARLAEAVGRPVFVENDANAGALGELTFGAGRNLSHFCYLHVARGLGLGIVQEAQLFRGAGGNAGEIGRIRLGPSDPATVEATLSLDGLAAALDRGGDEAAWTRETGEILRWLVGLVENAFDPQTIILGGALERPLAARLIGAAEPLGASIAGRLMRDAARLQPSPLGRDSAALGASVMPFIGMAEPDPAANWRYEGHLRDIYPD